MIICVQGKRLKQQKDKYGIDCVLIHGFSDKLFRVRTGDKRKTRNFHELMKAWSTRNGKSFVLDIEIHEDVDEISYIKDYYYE